MVRSICGDMVSGLVACRTHLYGDIYSSPGLNLQQKQLLMVAFLSQADMPDELFGHALAVIAPAFAAIQRLL